MQVETLEVLLNYFRLSPKPSCNLISLGRFRKNFVRVSLDLGREGRSAYTSENVLTSKMLFTAVENIYHGIFDSILRSTSPPVNKSLPVVKKY